MRTLRDTQAKLRSKVKFFGVEGGVLPVVISAAVSAMLIAIASQSGSIPMACLGTIPFVLTFGYLMVFVTGALATFYAGLGVLVSLRAFAESCSTKQTTSQPCSAKPCKYIRKSRGCSDGCRRTARRASAAKGCLMDFS